MIISPIAYGMPSGLVTPVTPSMAWLSVSVWHDDLNADVCISSGVGESGTQGGISGDRYQITSHDFYGQGQVFSIYTPLLQNITTAPDAGGAVFEVDTDAFMALEMGGEFEGVLTSSMMQVDPSWSIPRYVMAGTTLDCDTSDLLAGSQVSIHDPITGLIEAAGVSDGVGSFSVVVFEPGPHLVRAVNGVRTAISLPVNAELI